MRGDTEITNSQDIIDSRNVIDRIDHLDSELRDAYEGSGGKRKKKKFEEWVNDTAEDDRHTLQDAAKELKALKSLQDEAEGYCSDWKYGAALIRESYFTEYAEELAGEVSDYNPRKVHWPFTCIDWEKAADELKQDYTTVDFDGVDYYVR